MSVLLRSLLSAALLTLLPALLAPAAQAKPCRPAGLSAPALRLVAPTGAYGVMQHHPALPLPPRQVILSFDDGPDPVLTPQIQAILDQACIRAVFFPIGRAALAHPEVLQALQARGHAIGSHSFSHAILSSLSPAQAWVEIEQGAEAVAQALGTPGHRPRLLRYPTMAETPDLLERSLRAGYWVLGAEVTASDWQDHTPDWVIANILAQLQVTGGGMIVLHDVHARTVQALPGLLQALADAGYQVAGLEVAPAASGVVTALLRD